MNPQNYTIGYDPAGIASDHSCTVIFRKERGETTLIGEIYGEAAEYVNWLHEQIQKIAAHQTQKPRASVKLSEQLESLMNSPQRNEDRFQVLLHLCIQLAQDVESISERNRSHDILNTPMDAALRNQERIRQGNWKDVDFSKIELPEEPK